MLFITALFAGIAAAQVKGFNYGATLSNGACQTQDGFASLFQRAAGLQGASGFNSARLYTTIQCGTANDPTAAIKAAMDTDTSLLLGLWASAGSDAFTNEVTALSRAIQAYPDLADHVIGISVGSEDLYRSSPQGVANSAGVGATASDITNYISRVRQAIQGTSLAGKPVGHVDTWTAWVLPENAVVAQAVDWLGHNSFPYFETTHANSIQDGQANFDSALAATESVAGGRPVYVTETGWPHVGANSGQAVASVDNAETYWKSVGCSLFGSRNTWWYTLEDANTAQTDISFGITPADSSTPLFDLSCNNVVSPSSSSSSSALQTSTSQSSSSSTASSSSSQETSSSSTESPAASTSAVQTSSVSPTDSTTAVSSTAAQTSDQSTVFVTSTDGTGNVVTSTSFVGVSSSTSEPAITTTSSVHAAGAGRLDSHGVVMGVVLGALALF